MATLVRANRSHHPQRYECLPGYSASDNDFKSYFEWKTRVDSPARLELLREMSVARAMVLGEQWLDLNTTERDKWRAFRFHSQSPNAKFPRPTTNEILPIYDNETSKLARRKSSHYVRPVAQQEGTSGAAGAAKANDILDWQLETIGWSWKRRDAIRLMNLYGTVGFWSFLDQDYKKSIRIGTTDARRCTACSIVLATPQLPEGYNEIASGEGLLFSPSVIHTDLTYQGGSDYEEDGPREPHQSFTAKACVKCGGGLEDFVPGPDQLNGLDLFDRPLAKEVSLNQPDVDIVPPDELFLENEGIGISHPRQLRKVLRARPVPLDYIYDHYPEQADSVRKGDPRELAERYFNSGLYGYANVGTSPERDLFRDHVMLYTEIAQPTKRGGLEHGRLVEYAGGVRLRDEPLYRKSKRNAEVLIPLVKFSAARFFVKPGEFFGQGLVKPLISPQNRINMTWAQIVDTRQRHTVNGLLMPDGMKATSGWIEGWNGRYIRYQPDPQWPDHVPQFIPARTIDGGVYQELDRTVERMLWISGTQEADVGKAPRNVRAATAIQMLIEQAAGRRFVREEELIDCFKDVFGHQLLLLAEFAREPRSFRVKNAADKWEYRSFTGLDLEGHTDVVVEEQAGYDARAYERESILEAIQLGIVLVSTPYARREASKAIGVPQKVNDEENAQISDAESKWYAFRDGGVVPAEDEDLDDHSLMFGTYGRFLKSADGVKLALEANWGQVQIAIAGWEEKLRQARMVDQQTRSMLSLAKQPANREMLMAGMPDPALQARMTLHAMTSSGQDPLATLLPRLCSHQILTVWQNMGADISHPYVQFRAYVASHKVLFADKKMLASVAPVAAAPGGMQTPFGSEPTAGNMPAPGPGTLAPGIPANVTNAAQG
jgi:hypothetical protein